MGLGRREEVSKGTPDHNRAPWVASWMALGFHPQSYLGTVVEPWLGRGGRAEGLGGPVEAPSNPNQKHLPTWSGDEGCYVGSLGVTVSDPTHSLSPVTSRLSLGLP